MMVDIAVLGDKQLSKALNRLPDKAQRGAVRPAMRNSTKRIHNGIIQSLSGHPVGVRTGRYLTAMAGRKPVLIRAKTGLVGYVILMPTRDEMGIPHDTSGRKYGYYPAFLEYGTPKMAPRAPIRSTVNRMDGAELRAMGIDIGKGIEKEWRKLAGQHGLLGFAVQAR